MPLTHPEFGYIGTSSFRRGVIAFVICGSIAGGSGLAIFNANPDPDPRTAMALATAEILSDAARFTPARVIERNSAKDELGREALKTVAIRPGCPKTDTEQDCIAVQTHTARTRRVLNERPAIAAVPIGHIDGLPDVPAGSAIPVTAPETTAGSASPADIAPVADTAPAIAEAPAPALSVPKRRKSNNHVQRRYRSDYSRSSGHRKNYYQPNFQSGYARLW